MLGEALVFLDLADLLGGQAASRCIFFSFPPTLIGGGPAGLTRLRERHATAARAAAFVNAFV